MARLNTYTRVDNINTADAFVIDGPQGTRCVSIDVIMNYLPSNLITETELASTLSGTVGNDSSIADIDFAPYFLRDTNIIPSIAALSASQTVLNKSVSELQNEVVFLSNEVTGTLNYVEGYTDFSSVEEEQSGNYLAFQLVLNEEAGDVDLFMSYSNSPRDRVKFDSDRNAVIRVTDQNGNKGTLTIIATKKTDEYITRFDLNNLILLSKEEE